MNRKYQSNLAPDKWIRELNRRYPGLWAALRKGYSDPGKILHLIWGSIESLDSVPDWCIMPSAISRAVMEHKYDLPSNKKAFWREVLVATSAYIWRCSKGVYRFSPEIYQELVRQPLTGNLPLDCFYRMPEWAVYIETHGMYCDQRLMEGFIAHLDYRLFSRKVELQFTIFYKDTYQPDIIRLPLEEGTLNDIMDRLDQENKEYAERRSYEHLDDIRNETIQGLSSMIQLLLYICSDEPDMPEIEHPQKRKRFCGGVRPPEEPRVWDVGVRISKAMRKYNANPKMIPVNIREGVPARTHASPRPHIRSAHWHRYWTGPRDAGPSSRKMIVRWIPPLPVGMNWKTELPTNIRVVDDYEDNTPA